jgi:hypothetical protein
MMEIFKMKPDLNEFTYDELIAELTYREAERARIKATESKLELPELLTIEEMADKFRELVTWVVKSLNEAIDENWIDDNFKHFCYESLLTTIFGNKIWDVINKIGDENG